MIGGERREGEFTTLSSTTKIRALLNFVAMEAKSKRAEGVDVPLGVMEEGVEGVEKGVKGARGVKGL